MGWVQTMERKGEAYRGHGKETGMMGKVRRNEKGKRKVQNI